MIILDLESSGINTGKAGIWQIGAIEFENPKNQFLEEGRIDNEDKVVEGAIKVTGKTEEEMRDKNKQSQKQLILNFLEWAKTCEERVVMGHNVGWDISFIQNKCLEHDIIDQFREVMSQRSIDLHTLAQIKKIEKEGKFSTAENKKSNMNLSKVMEFCGLSDNRISLQSDGEIKKEGKIHDALEDCKIEGECYSRLIYGKNLFSRYAKFKIPEVLKK